MNKPDRSVNLKTATITCQLRTWFSKRAHGLLLVEETTISSLAKLG